MIANKQKNLYTAKEKAEPRTRIASRFSLVPVTGVEPVRCRHHWILSFTGC